MKKHKKIIAIQGDAIQTINSKTDTTLLLAMEAQKLLVIILFTHQVKKLNLEKMKKNFIL